MKKMKIDAYAKVNFTLEVLSKRADGYHALRSLVVPITLSDTLEFTPSNHISSNSPYSDDLCIKAARLLRSYAPSGADLLGAEISIEKRIPAGGGLGGGSADAAATLVALNEMWQLGFSPEKLADIGAQVGSDVPALVLARFYGSIIMEGRGEIVKPLGGINRKLNLVLVNPGVFVSTPKVFKNCISRVTEGTKILYNMCSSLESGDLCAISSALMNDLEAPAIELCPEVATAKQALQSCGVQKPVMSGSGSTVFGLVSSEEEGHKIVASLRASGFLAWCVETYCPVV